jgi:hypothetical protein
VQKTWLENDQKKMTTLSLERIHHNYIPVHYQKTHGYQKMTEVFDCWPPDIFVFTEFHENISNDSLNINGFVQERKDITENCGGGWLACISEI